VAAGTHPRVAQALLRHTTSRITLDVYSASTRAQEREAADALDRLLA
jgi:HD superfamily phosphodiesterase